eukprot:Trichotokara_eunicae@DN5776_c0_g1_i1.p1
MCIRDRYQRRVHGGTEEVRILNSIDHLNYHSGADYKENQLDALRRSITQMSWNPNEINRAVILFTDSLWHAKGDHEGTSFDLNETSFNEDPLEACKTKDYPSAQFVLQKAQEAGVEFVFYVPASVADEYQALCDQFVEGGVECVCLPITKASDAVEHMEKVIRSHRIPKKFSRATAKKI